MSIQTVVLVHGAFSDGSCFMPVIRHLQQRGLRAIAVQNPLSSLSDDVAVTQYVLNKVADDVLLVGHSYGGAVITQAGDLPNVKQLAYLSAIVPDNAESAVQALQRANAPAGGLEPDDKGLIWLPENAFYQVMANDLSETESRLYSAVQTPLNIKALTEPTSKTAWKTRPSHYLITENDNALPSNVQRQFAAHIQAQTHAINAGHLSMLSQAEQVADWLTKICVHAV